METFSALLAICAGNSPGTGEFPTQRPVTRSFDVYFDLRLNKRLCKQSGGWWFETLLCPLWRHSNEIKQNVHKVTAVSSKSQCFLYIPGARPTKHISIEFEIRWNFKTLLCKIYAADHNDIFAPVTTVSLSWRVQNIVVIGRVYSKLEHSEFSNQYIA